MATWHRDFFEIDLDKVQEPKTHNSGKFTAHDMRGWLVAVKEIQKLCRERGSTTSDFHKFQNSSNPNEQLIYDTYCHLYELSISNIKVNWDNDRYSIDNGNHRILIAKQLGLRHLPAQVQSSDKNTLAVLKASGEKISKFEKPLTSQQKLEWFK